MKFIDEIKRKFSAKVHIRCGTIVNEMIQRLVLDGPDKLKIISDFDRTISDHIGHSEHKNKSILCTFSLFEMCESLPKDYKKKALALTQKNIPIEAIAQMTEQQKLQYVQKFTEEWWSENENLLKGIRFNYEDIEKSIKKANVKLRDGSAEAFNKLCVQNIPLIVMSAGLGDVVELTLKLENLLTDNVSVVSNFLKVTKDNSGVSTIHGYKGDKPLNIFNKHAQAFTDAHKNDTHLSRRFNVIFVGGYMATLADSIGIRGGGIPLNTVLRIGLIDSDLGEHENEYLHRYERSFDIVLVQDHAMELLNYLLEEIIGKHQQSSTNK